MMTLIGDRYTLGEVIGTGGMSEVYAAEDTLIGRGVAVKMLRLELARDVNFRERFRREAQNSGRLNHPSIVAVYDTGETVVDGIDVPYIVMERIHGRTLREVIREGGPLSPARAAQTLVPVCHALQASHDAGIIHRDIKPANIMITNTGDVKVMDFGIARALDDSTSAMTQTSAVIGTAQYLSPEQARGKAADGRSDVYGLGCVLYEAITGRPPFEGESPFAVAYQHVQENPTPPSELVAEPLSPTAAINVDAVVLTAMAKHPADRYQSAAAMGEDLQRLGRNAVTDAARHHIAAEEDRAREEEPPTVVAPPVRPTRVAGAAPAAAPATAAAAQAAPSGGSHRREDRGNRWLAWVAALLALVAVGVGGAFLWDLVQGRDDEVTMSQLVTVPDVTGTQRAEAVAQLEELELRVDVNEEPSPDIPRGEVIRTNPTAGSQLQKGTAVTVTVSSGREITDVPDVRGMTPQEAADALAAVDLQLEQQVREVSSEDVTAGRIAEQSPAPGSQLSKGSRVSVAVSTGPALVRVPSITGMQLEQAEETLASVGLSSQVTSVDSFEREGQILSVANEGAMVAPGTAVGLEVSNGMLVTMPDLTRLSQADALAALREAGWEGTDAQLRTGDPVPTGALVDQGLIGAQEPANGASIRKDATVTVRYWEFDVGTLIPGTRP
ncbi:Stk1 family PASTA domain-containing Ser/Thr kinase [Corynebacterium suedekumii]|uniref:non-specific serine/threonine protein kinase n=1 Tax=Corynebacterium suedekumii TaxID=3049801 RepID=A0ABY8VPK4_9CORY|nr:Stk1 family PASTA domain-containing Ser/Thr kinase [Corynebacterium suedekumii]WIM71580.1 Stk1 family PASTA domain-containing Ser/Thr kinase [Corynebacterium suedekumii]